ncbi:MAG: hypothetical protein GY851_05305 [bacterium]|nr:hypothetical protein [bacterium]
MKVGRMVFAGMTMLVAAGVTVAQAPDIDGMDIVLRSVPDGPVARVNGQMVDSGAFRDLYTGELTRFAQMNPGRPINDEARVALAFSTLRALLEQEVLRQSAVERGLTVSDEELEAGWERELAALQKALARGSDELPSESEVLEMAGANKDAAMAELREALLIEKTREAIIDEAAIEVTDAEVAEWFEANKQQTRRPDMCHLQQIFIRFPQGRAATPDKIKAARDKAASAMKRLRSGETFEGVAKELTDHPEPIREKGGDIGTGPVMSLPEPLQKAVYEMQAGAIGEPIETTMGLYIMKLIEFVPGEEMTLETTSPRIRTLLMSRKGTRAVRAYCAEATGKESSVQVYLDLEKQLVGNPELAASLSNLFGGEPEEAKLEAVPDEGAP